MIAINASGRRTTISVTDRKVTARDFADPDEAKPGDYLEVSVCDT
jgi:hypothetical protein